jgi:hypothetical protein
MELTPEERSLIDAIKSLKTSPQVKEILLKEAVMSYDSNGNIDFSSRMAREGRLLINFYDKKRDTLIMHEGEEAMMVYADMLKNRKNNLAESLRITLAQIECGKFFNEQHSGTRTKKG